MVVASFSAGRLIRARDDDQRAAHIARTSLEAGRFDRP
jgi:hypothetical protein